jgi:hypothetical protein
VRVLTATVAIVLLAASGGCGGGSDSSSTGTIPAAATPPGSSSAAESRAVERTAFGKRVTAACFTGSQALGSLPPFPDPAFDSLHPEVAKLPAIARFFERGPLPAYEKLLGQLKAIDPPAAEKPKYDEFVHQVDALVADLKRQIAAAKGSDAKGFTAAVRAAGGTGLPDAESALGIRACYGIS